LADVPHGVLGTVSQAAEDGGRQLRPSDPSKIAERGNVDSFELVDRRFDACVQSRQHRGNIGRGEHIAFSPHRCELLRRQRVAARVGEEPIDYARHVPDVKGRRCNASRARVPFGFCQARDELIDTLANLQENVRNRL
jgi:hypothetical protein